MAKERYQKPVVGDELNLRFFSFNSNTPADTYEISKVDIFYLDNSLISEDNPDGRRLVDSITDIDHNNTGQYSITATAEDLKYVIGNYRDVWYVKFEESDVETKVEQEFTLYPDLWITSPTPITYDFTIRFQPNRFRIGSKRYIVIEIIPNVPTASDLNRFYYNLAIISGLKISIEQMCGPCVPQEQDLRLIVDEEEVVYREKNQGFYYLDTSDMEEGIYNVWFTLELGDNVYITDKNQIQITS